MGRREGEVPGGTGMHLSLWLSRLCDGNASICLLAVTCCIYRDGTHTPPRPFIRSLTCQTSECPCVPNLTAAALTRAPRTRMTRRHWRWRS